ncbi:hypothetical protein ABQ333_16640 [Serratia fonticola]|uniref:hypothetical protein n=1 Tax=Serratia fonticola TaxID=47917 RepID=UPI003AAA6C32
MIEVSAQGNASSWQAVLVFSAAPPRTPHFAARMRKRQKTLEQHTALFLVNILKNNELFKTPINIKT